MTGKRGHYELAAGRDVTSYIKAMQGFSSDGGLLAEQLWDAEDLPEENLFFGKPAGSAMPLCWAHAEFISLVRSQQDNICYDRIASVYHRYVENGQSSDLELWTFAHQSVGIDQGKPLRIICNNAGKVHWTSDNWASQHDTVMKAVPIGLHYADLPTAGVASGSEIIFTFH